MNENITTTMCQIETAAIERLLAIASHGGREATGQSNRVATFLLAWWNARNCGGFDLTDTWGVDTDIAEDMITVFTFVARNRVYPDAVGYDTDFKALVAQWRPELDTDYKDQQQ